MGRRKGTALTEPIGQEDDARWLAPTALLDPREPRVAFRTRSLTQLLATEREKALALYAYVKRIPFAMPYKVGLRAPREVLYAGQGDALDKLGVLLAMLRHAGIACRIRVMHLVPGILQPLNLLSATGGSVRAVLEARIGGAWSRTDTYLYDAEFVSSARRVLRGSGQLHGWGLHVTADSLWAGAPHPWLVGAPYAGEKLVPREQALYADPGEFVDSAFVREHYPRLTHALRWNASIPGVNAAIEQMRKGRDRIGPGEPARE
jgi:hypothetical protein